MKYIFITILFVSLILSACQPANQPIFEGGQDSIGTSAPDPLTEPPPAVLQIGELEQESGISSYCWTVPGEEHGVCADGIGFGTAPVPMMVEGSFAARFTNPLSADLDFVSLSIRHITLADKLPDEPGGMYWWRPESEDQITKNPTPPDYEVELTLEPGLYLLNYFANWEEFGDVTYSFLVEILPAGS